MSGRISIDNLSDSLKEMIENSGMTEEQIIELLKSKGINELQTNSKNVIDAINELFQNANNGKELIADAIGEPVSSDDTFSAMSNDIHGLLSTFKTNMMKNGVTVESGDKFKALIDKIATMVEDGEGKGLMYINGTATEKYSKSFTRLVFSISNKVFSYIEIPKPDFSPMFIIVSRTYSSSGTTITSGELVVYDSNSNKVFYSQAQSSDSTGVIFEIDSNVNDDTYIYLPTGVGGSGSTIEYHIIGVGEEDTTLRDSLANILEDKGVDVSPEDDMATLIGKVDGISSGGLDIISATSLPDIGKENQICVITDTEPTAYVTSVSPNSIEISDNIVRFHISNNESYTKVLIPLGNNIISEFIFDYVYQNKSAKASYIYQNSVWTQLTYNNQYLLKNAAIQAGYSAIQTDSTYPCYCKSGTGFVLKQTYDSSLLLGIPFKESIDFSKYNNVRIKGSYKNASLSGVNYEATKPRIGIAILNQTYNGSYSFSGSYKVETLSEAAYGKASNVTGTTTQATFDLTFPIGYSKTGYFAIDSEYINYVCVTDIEFFLK